MSIELDESARVVAPEGPAEPSRCLSANPDAVPAISYAENSIADEGRASSQGLLEQYDSATSLGWISGQGGCVWLVSCLGRMRSAFES